MVYERYIKRCCVWNAPHTGPLYFKRQRSLTITLTRTSKYPAVYRELHYPHTHSSAVLQVSWKPNPLSDTNIYSNGFPEPPEPYTSTHTSPLVSLHSDKYIKRVMPRTFRAERNVWRRHGTYSIRSTTRKDGNTKRDIYITDRSLFENRCSLNTYILIYLYLYQYLYLHLQLYPYLSIFRPIYLSISVSI